MEDDNDSLGASVLFEAASQELDPTIQTYGQWLDESPMLLALLWTFHIQIWFLDGSFIGVQIQYNRMGERSHDVVIFLFI